MAFKNQGQRSSSSFRLPSSMELITALAPHDSQNHPHFLANSINLNEATETTDVNMHIISNTSLDPHPPTTVTPDQSTTIENEEEGGVTDNDPNIQGINDQQTTRLDGSIVDLYALYIVLTMLTFVFTKLQKDIHNPLNIAKPVMLLIVVGLGISYATYCVLSWINDRSGHKMLKGLYYIACNLVFVMLLVVVFTTT